LRSMLHPFLVLWVVTPCRVVVGYQRFGGPSCILVQGEVNLVSAGSSETLVMYRISTEYRNPEDRNLNNCHCGNVASCMLIIIIIIQFETLLHSAYF